MSPEAQRIAESTMQKHIFLNMKIKELPSDASLGGVRFRYPGDGKIYYWYSQWSKGVWGKKDMDSGQIFPLIVENIEQALEWEVIPEKKE